MHDTFNITSPAPNRGHIAHFVCSGEIRFGPLYYALSVDAYSFGQRIFGAAHLWSPSASLLALQEWLTIDYAEGPITALVLIDLMLRREVFVARVRKGFIVPQAFEGPILFYRKDYAGQEGIEHFEVDSTKMTEWKSLPE